MIFLLLRKVKELSAAIDSGEDVTSKVLYLVEIAQVNG